MRKGRSAVRMRRLVTTTAASAALLVGILPAVAEAQSPVAGVGSLQRATRSSSSRCRAAR